MTAPEQFYGLSADEVAERISAGQDNKPPKGPSKSAARVIFDHTFTYFNGIFAIIAIILILVKSYRDLTFLGVILANTLIGIIQELRTKKILDNLTMLNTARTTVIRDGVTTKITTDELVLDDIVIFKAGEQIPADAKILDGEVSVNEALLTGEADEITKKSGAELLSGSFIVSGECHAQLTRVGEDSYISKLTLQAKTIKTGEQSEIIKSLNKIVRLAGIAVIPVGIILYAHQLLVNHAPIRESAQGAASAVLGMIPEGLFLLASVSLAIGAVKLARQKVLVREMKCIETLARVDVLCVDKTGTITSPQMKVKKWLKLQNDENIEKSLTDFIHIMSADNETIKSLKNHFKLQDTPKIATQIFGFSSKYKYSAATFGNKNFVLGAPEFTLKEQFKNYKQDIQTFTKKGYRVLVFGEYAAKLNGGELLQPIKPLAMIILENPIRKTAARTFKYFREQGVNIKVISGDNPLTVAEVARQAKIDGAESYIDASTLKTEAQITEAVKKYTVFGRVTPEQKRKFVKALKSQGHYVAMTGDGVNDVLALKDADCSIAMASGSDAAVQVAQLVLLESDFSKMPQVVREGRRVVNNLERSGSLFIVKNIFSLLAALLTLALGVRYPLLPAQVSMLSVWTIGLPSFFLAQTPNEDIIKGRFMANIFKKAIPGGITSLLAVFATVGIGKIIGIPETETSTACALAFATVSMIYLYRICQPLNLYRGIVFTGCMIGLFICFGFLRNIFSLAEEISIQSLMICAGLALIAWPMLEFLPKLFDSELEKIVTKLEKSK